MTEDRHPHGTPARYSHGPRGDGVDPCRDECCRAAHRESKRARHRRNAYNHSTMVDATPTREHVRALMAAGMGVPTIVERSGVPHSTLVHLLYGDPSGGRPPSRTVRVATAHALQAVTADLEMLSPRAKVDGVGTRRRLQALVAAGHPPVDLARRLGTHRQHVRQLLTGDRDGCAATAIAVRELTTQLWDQPPDRSTPQAREAVRRALAAAARHGWAPLAAWDDVDNPDEQPVGVRRAAA